jgi:hypothetical protein
MRKALAIGVPSLVVLMLVHVAAAQAQSSVTVTLTPEGQAYATSQGSTAQTFSDDIQKRVNEAYGANNVNGFLRGFADAASFSNRGLGVDYASLPNHAIVGVGATVSAVSDGIPSRERPVGGAAANFAVMAALNLGTFDLPRWTVSAHGLYYKASSDELRGAVAGAGAHLQYKLLKPREGLSSTLLLWNGLDITAGVELLRWGLGATHTISTDVVQNGQTLKLDSTGTFDVTTTTMTVPIEATTGFRIALLATVYAGAGIDLQYGKTSVNADLVGKLHTADNATELATANIKLDGSNTPHPLAPRALLGVQLNLWKLKIYVQGTVSAIPAASLGAGVRLVL